MWSGSARSNGRSTRPRIGRLAPLRLAVNIALIVAAAAAVLSWPSQAERANDLELAVEATYLYKLPPFIEWPSGAFLSPEAPLRLCVVGDNLFGALLDRAVSGQHVGGREIVVVPLDGASSGALCHVAYLADASARAAIASFKGQPVLTVTSAATEPAEKGIVNFVLVADHVRFEVDLSAASENHLKLSSKLLNIAVSVSPRP